MGCGSCAGRDLHAHVAAHLSELDVILVTDKIGSFEKEHQAEFATKSALTACCRTY